MVLMMSRPYRHPVTGYYWSRKVIPEPLRPILGKREMKESLRTRDPAEAKRRHPPVMARFEAIVAGARAQLAGKASVPTLREIDAALGHAYQQEAAKWAGNPGTAEKWDHYGGHYVDMFVLVDEDTPNWVWVCPVLVDINEAFA